MSPMSESFVIGAQEKSVILGRLAECVLNQLHWMWLVKTLLLSDGLKTEINRKNELEKVVFPG